MFKNPRYLTCGVDATIPPRLQSLLWNLIDLLPPERDYLQVFWLEPFGEMQKIIHTAEVPAFKQIYLFPTDTPISEKIYVIYDSDHTTMLLASEY